MNPDSVHTSASDSARWPAYNETAARAILVDPFAGEIVKTACRLILGGLRKDDAIKAASILATEDNRSTFARESRLRGLLYDAGVLV